MTLITDWRGRLGAARVALEYPPARILLWSLLAALSTYTLFGLVLYGIEVYYDVPALFTGLSLIFFGLDFLMNGILFLVNLADNSMSICVWVISAVFY